MSRAAGILFLFLGFIGSTFGYSVLSHEAIVDSSWESHIRPLLLQHFPGATPDQLKEAHAYVYGGCLLQDMGYAPFASRFFSDLAHYARSGDFVVAMLKDAQTLDEYAFALGTLAHYEADRTGHPVINRITPLSYPKLAAKFGPVVTYEDNKVDHLKTEFGLDVIQVSRGLYAPDNYHDFIGFEVAQAGLDRAFRSTYGIELSDLFFSEDLAIGTYRFSVGRLIPQATNLAWDSKRGDIEKLSPSMRRQGFIYSLPRTKYEKTWGKHYRKPGFFARVLAILFRLVPTFGPFNALKFHPVPASGEKMFLDGFNASVAEYQKVLTQIQTSDPSLANMNLDTGAATRAGDYRLADHAYAELLDKLASKHFQTVTPDLRDNIQAFFAQMNASKLSADTVKQLEELKAAALTGL